MWIVSADGMKEFRNGKQAWRGAAEEASRCMAFFEDVEEEMVADDPRSCYNCRYRRWTATSFACMRP